MDTKVTEGTSEPMEMWDSPIGGAYLIWRFVKGYVINDHAGPILLCIFPALAIVMNSQFSDGIGKAASLSEYAYVFHDSSGKAAKSLAGLQDRIVEMRDWILRSLEFALVTRLVELSPETGRLSLCLKEEVPASVKIACQFKNSEGRDAERIGNIFAKTKEGDIAYYLGVKF